MGSLIVAEPRSRTTWVTQWLRDDLHRDEWWVYTEALAMHGWEYFERALDRCAVVVDTGACLDPQRTLDILGDRPLAIIANTTTVDEQIHRLERAFPHLRGTVDVRQYVLDSREGLTTLEELAQPFVISADELDELEQARKLWDHLKLPQPFNPEPWWRWRTLIVSPSPFAYHTSGPNPSTDLFSKYIINPT